MKLDFAYQFPSIPAGLEKEDPLLLKRQLEEQIRANPRDQETLQIWVDMVLDKDQPIENEIDSLIMELARLYIKRAQIQTLQNADPCEEGAAELAKLQQQMAILDYRINSLQFDLLQAQIIVLQQENDIAADRVKESPDYKSYDDIRFDPVVDRTNTEISRKWKEMEQLFSDNVPGLLGSGIESHLSNCIKYGLSIIGSKGIDIGLILNHPMHKFVSLLDIYRSADISTLDDPSLQGIRHIRFRTS